MNNTKKPLAIFTPVLGRWAHSFVQAHIERILPEKTIVVAIIAFRPVPPCWGVDAPVLSVLDDLDHGDLSVTTEFGIYSRLPAEAQRVFYTPQHTRRIETFLRENGVRVILAQWMHSTLPLVELARNMGLRYYCQTHGSDITMGLEDREVARAYRGYNETMGVIAPSEFGRRQLLELGIRPDRAHVIRHPIHCPSEPITRPSAPVRCLAVGRMEPMKSPLLIIDAFRRALESRPDLHLDYVGDGTLRARVEQAIHSAGIGHQVTLHGYLVNDQAQEMMRRSHIFIHPSSAAGGSRYDTCPVAIGEAMVNGMAIVATRHGGIPEEIEDGQSGLLVDENDGEAVAERIVELAGDEGLRRRLGEAARIRARALFSEDAVRGNWLELLQLAE